MSGPQDTSTSRLARRGFVKAAAVVAGAAAVPAAAARATAAQTSILSGGGFVEGRTPAALVAATVVRADLSREAFGTLKVGVRASIASPAGVADGVVLVVDGVAFGAAPAALNGYLTEAVRTRAAAFLAERGQPTDPEEIAVRLFGGAL
jgi:hypothetical protein